VADVYEHLGELESAEASIARAVELAPEDADVLRAQAEWLERHRKAA
jgi:Tfp pilus assembly protein PilF